MNGFKGQVGDRVCNIFQVAVGLSVRHRYLNLELKGGLSEYPT
jgi:hypothetical protein